jgi:hypothetical protein
VRLINVHSLLRAHGEVLHRVPACKWNQLISRPFELFIPNI